MLAGGILLLLLWYYGNLPLDTLRWRKAWGEMNLSYFLTKWLESQLCDCVGDQWYIHHARFRYLGMLLCKFAIIHLNWYDLCKYASIICMVQVFKYASMILCKSENIQVCKYMRFYVCKYERIQVRKDTGI